MIRVSVVVPTFQRAARLPGLIAALEAQTVPAGEFDVIVADDGSTDETPAVLADLAARARVDLRVVRNPRNGGAGAARNLGWRASSAPVIAFTDDDCLPAPGWLEAGLARLRDGSLGIVQGRTLPDPTAGDGVWVDTKRIEEFTKRYETCNIFYRTDVLRAVGGFEEDAIPFGEDMIVGWKARRLRVAGVYEPEALIRHAVFYPGFRYYWRHASNHRTWVTLVRRFPEMRREYLKFRVFIGRRHAAFLGAVVGVIAGTVWRPALVLAIPYAMVWLVLDPPRFRFDKIVAKLLEPVWEAAVITEMAIGSVRERTIVL